MTKKATLFIISFIAMLFVSVQVVSAAAILDPTCSDAAAKSSTVCVTDKNTSAQSNPISGQNGILLKAYYLIAIGVGVVATIMIIVSGIRLVTSSGDPNTVNIAKNTIIYSVIGIVVVLLAGTIITFVLKRF